MRTRNMGALTNYEIEQYLVRNDVVFIPLGTVELHGPMPMDCEYVLAEAMCYELAERCDGLVLPHLTFFHPGATDIGRGTVYMSMTDGQAYLRAICQSLLNQGFRRQVLITGHGPAFMTALPMLTQFLDETKVPLFYSDIGTLMGEVDLGGDFRIIGEMMIGAYKKMNRMEDIPIGLWEPEITIMEGSDMSHCLPESMKELYPKHPGLSNGYWTAWKYGNKLEHGGIEKPIMSQEELEERAEQGYRYITALADGLNFNEKLDALRELDQFHQNVIMPLYGEHLVRNRYPEPNTQIKREE